MFHIILYQPEIPPNTGNIIRLCANTGSQLHLIHPLGFSVDDRSLRRAGLDYRDAAIIKEYDSLQDCLQQIEAQRVYACSTRGTGSYHEVAFAEGDALLFGPETRGLPAEVLASLPENQVIRVPMQENSRSLNLSNTVAIIVYEAWRQQGFGGEI